MSAATPDFSAAGLVPTPTQRHGAEVVARFRSQGWWGGGSASELLDRWADATPTRQAVSDGYGALDYATLRARAHALAHRLHALGVQPGDRVVMQLPNWTESAVTYWAVAALGAVIVPVIMIYRHAELRRIVENSGAVVAVTAGSFRQFDHAAMFRELQADCPTLRHLLLARAVPQVGETALDEASAPGAADGPGRHGPAWRRADPDAPHVIVYTSGTESTSKGCVHTWNTFTFSARGLVERIFRLTPADCMFMPSPVGHATGLMQGLLVPLIAGAEAHVLDIWDPAVALRRIEAFRCTGSATATPFVRMVLDAARASGSRHDLRSMRTWVCAGAPIPTELASEFAATFSGGRLVPLYGCSEINVATSCTGDDPPARLAGTAGRPALGGVELTLRRADGSAAAPGEEGEIWYRGPGAMLGYWRDPERTAKVLDGEGWYHTADLAVGDAEGYIRVTGRLKDIIIRGGSNISAGEVEGYVLDHPAVQNVAVVPFPDERLGERACAVVVLHPGQTLTLEALVDFLRAKRISPQKLPERLRIVERLPMTPTGKVQKFVLRQLLADETLAVNTSIG